MPKHLAQGSVEPPLPPGKLRLFGMRFCPYDHRVHLVLLAKNIPHDTVFINLKNKPDWFVEKIPSTKVPGLIVDGQVLYESLIIADFLDEKYPERPLHSKDVLQKAKDRILIEEFSKVSSGYYKFVMNKPSPVLEDFDAVVKSLEVFETKLAGCKTKFFAGSEPGMVDYMIWPWFERFGAAKTLFGKQFDLPEEKLKHLICWKKEMLADRAVKEYFISPEDHGKYLQSYMTGTPDFDIPV